MPEMWIVAGPNGAGKTTLTREKFAEEVDGMAWVNPDDTTLLLQTEYRDLAVAPESMKANFLAATVSDGRVDHMIETGQSFVVETVLSSLKFLERVARAKQNGFTVLMVYVTLRRPYMSIQRVATRVENGGHDVDSAKIVKRWVRSLKNLYQFADVVDALTVWDNSTEGSSDDAILLMDKENGRTRIHDAAAVADIQAVLETIDTGGG